MKKIIAISLVAITTAFGGAYAAGNPRETRISDIVRVLEENPEYIEPMRATLKSLPVKKITSINGVSTNKVVGDVQKLPLPGNGSLIGDGGKIDKDTPDIKLNGEWDANGNYLPTSMSDVLFLMDNPMVSHLLCQNKVTREHAVIVTAQATMFYSQYASLKIDFYKMLQEWLLNNCL